MITERRFFIIPAEVIPEKKVEHDVYIADDGKEFLDEWECQKHETEEAYIKLKHQSLMLPVFTKNIPDDATLIRLETKKDFDVVVDDYSENNILNSICDFKGPGVYCITFSSEPEDEDYHFRYAFFIRPVADVTSELREAIDIIESFVEECKNDL